MKTYEGRITPIPLNPRLLLMPGFSERQILEHFEVLYKGYVNKVNEIRSLLPSADRQEANATYSEFRCLKKGETYAIDGVILHELYFDNLGGPGGVPRGDLMRRLERDFGSYQSWLEDFTATGISARGWAVLVYDPRDGRLHNYLLDAHDHGVVQNTAAILVLDVYEHAYFIDYGTRKADYIRAFMQNVDWSVAERRWDRIRRLYDVM
ncbi:superoxide dismutase [Thermosediminibacter oceani]|uniref:superoxide dismutase n=1 Tax=Thermosediminibacter oceani (strain ATCC BAA-1034 / DSM 16646 / JW/IW-1228P) TaxID=555079 RepID=D9RYR0_THEOJ|nr:Fe-Mn family superoxide dismutase [Thermosediminibacter oceani]ADL08484.1 Superoxide dismutase [Thermosediminibacter oceani DSM 16646]